MREIEGQNRKGFFSSFVVTVMSEMVVGGGVMLVMVSVPSDGDVLRARCPKW